MKNNESKFTLAWCLGVVAILAAMSCGVGAKQFTVTDKSANMIKIKHNKRGYTRVVSFSKAWTDSVVYSNVNVGDNLRCETLRDNKSCVANNGDYIKRINNKVVWLSLIKSELSH